MAVKINPIVITDKALEAVRATKVHKNISGEYGLRVGIKGSGCSGEFIIGFDTHKEHDNVFEVKGIKLIIDKRHTMYLMGVEVDYTDSDGVSGFVFRTNENTPS